MALNNQQEPRPKPKVRTFNQMLLEKQAKAARAVIRQKDDTLTPPLHIGTETIDLAIDESPVAIPLMKTNDTHCRWPITAPAADMLVCGAKIVCAPYCPRHARRAYPGWQG